MPKLTFRAEGVEPQTWEFSFGRITLGEMASIQRMTKLSWDEVKQRFMANDVIVVHALVYTFLKREKPSLQAFEVEFFEDDYDLALTESEVRAQIAALTDAEARQALTAASELSDQVTTDEDRLAVSLLRERVEPSEESAGPKDEVEEPRSSSESPSTNGLSLTSSTSHPLPSTA